MKNIKRIDMDSFLIDGVVYSLNPIKKIEVKSQRGGYYIESIKIDGIYYYPTSQIKIK